MTTSRPTVLTADPNADPSEGQAIAWGRAVLGVLLGALLGAGYSLGTRSDTMTVMAQLTPSVVETPAPLSASPTRSTPSLAASFLAKPAAAAELRDVSLRSIQPASAGDHPTMAFRSIATLSAPSRQTEAEVRALKGAPVAGDDAISDSGERVSRSTGRVDAVAAVWGFLAVGLGGSTANARPSANYIRRAR